MRQRLRGRGSYHDDVTHTQSPSVARNVVPLAVGATVLLVPTVALANVGTPLIWATMSYLVFGNAVIGIVEGLVVARYFGCPRFTTVTIAVLANYLSAIPGLFLAAWLGFVLEDWFSGPALWRGPYVLALLVAVVFVASALLELPFYFWAIGSRPSRTRESIQASFLAQACSHLVLVPAAVLVSPISLYTSTFIRSDLSFVRPPLADVFFVVPDSDEIRRIRTDGSETAMVSHLDHEDYFQRLVFMGTDGSPTWDLWLVGRNNDGQVASHIASGLSARRVDSHDSADPSGQRSRGSHWWRRLHDLREAKDRTWTARCGTWEGEGLTVWNDEGTFFRRVALETPFARWHCRNPTVLPSGQIVFQLHRDIVIYDPMSRELGFLVRGSGPAVLVP